MLIEQRAGKAQPISKWTWIAGAILLALTGACIAVAGLAHAAFTRGSLSETTSGIKALLVKAITPLLAKRGKERIVPFQITGTYGQTKVGIDWKRR